MVAFSIVEMFALLARKGKTLRSGRPAEHNQEHSGKGGEGRGGGPGVSITPILLLALGGRVDTEAPARVCVLPKSSNEASRQRKPHPPLPPVLCLQATRTPRRRPSMHR
eukprot:364858-Chlamydomonas_euryale.AAC.3